MQRDVFLDDWVRDKSRVLGRRIEALNAFHARLRRERVVKASADEFESRYAAFLRKPA